MKGMILEIRGLWAIVLLPDGELRRVLRRRGWRMGMLVDPDAARSGGFARAAVAMAALLVVMLGLGGMNLLGPKGKDEVAVQRQQLILSTPEGTELIQITPSPSPEPSATPTLSPTPSPTPTATPKASHHDHKSDDDDDDDDDRYEICEECGEMGHDDDEHCEFCKELGHETEDCPILPEGWSAETCDYCGLFGHDDDDCPAAPPGWDD